MAGCDHWLPRYHWRTHQDRTVPAPPAAAARAVREVRPGDMYALRPLVFVRSVPARLTSRKKERFLAKEDRVIQGLYEGVGAFPLLDEPEGDLIVGFVGRPWKLRQEWLTLTPEQYREFDEPGHIKGLMAFSATGREGGTALHTETRVYGTDRAAVRRFRPYWLLIEPFSSLIRHDWLAAADRNARSAARP
ncbi:hypothetical protein IHE55_27855 [Streptomyces pactum]|uniref:DUF2867 domain-containing protein n=2 Tax=Streptomyces pactum TaxID=68249 RepID=A0ABS0NT71_9ACTN|nr:hypothetical protein [Streptomyces pactum]MBH5338395.1 hypothetical protein [Streptomyces pactum]